MGSPNHGAAHSPYDFPQTSQNYVEAAAMMMPKRMTGIKHMLHPACKHLPMPMSMGWQENPVDDDYPQCLLVPGLQLSDIDSNATRPVVAPWMHALYSMTHDNQPSGVTEVKLEDAHFAKPFTWQYFLFFFESSGMYFNIHLKGDLNRSPYFTYTCRLPNFTSEPRLQTGKQHVMTMRRGGTCTMIKKQKNF
jgi:hypothetical protein